MAHKVKFNSPLSETKSSEDNTTAAKVFTNCFASAALAINKLHGHKLNSAAVMQNLMESADRIEKGSVIEIDQMLMTQAKALDYLFYETLNKLPGINMINQLLAYADIALKAQNQSRKALVALAEIMHPKRTTFIKQQNNAVNQQVNNAPESTLEASEKKEIISNELLENKNGQWLDRGTKTATISNDSSVETLATSRSKDR